MADSYPYISGAGNLVQAITHFRKSFPATVTADTLKKLGIAPNNESYVINTLRFIGVLDSESKKTPEATKAFSQHEDGDFNKEFAPLVQSAYKDLFEIHGDRAWNRMLIANQSLRPRRSLFPEYALRHPQGNRPSIPILNLVSSGYRDDSCSGLHLRRSRS